MNLPTHRLRWLGAATALTLAGSAIAPGLVVAQDAAWSRSHSATRAPLAAIRCAVARPIPAAPPVITAQRPFRSISFIGVPVEAVVAVDSVSDAPACASMESPADRR